MAYRMPGRDLLGCAKTSTIMSAFPSNGMTVQTTQPRLQKEVPHDGTEFDQSGGEAWSDVRCCCGAQLEQTFPAAARKT